MGIPQNLLEFKVGNQFFGVDGDKIEQILRVPSITSIPLSSSFQKGVTVLSGKIVSVFDLGLILGVDEIDVSKDCVRLLTTSLNGVDYAILVDEVMDMSIVNEENYESAQDKEEKIVGFYKKDEEICQVLSLETIVESMSVESFLPQKLENMSANAGKNADSNISQDEDRMLFFNLAKEKFAINISILRELIFVPKSITPIAESDDFVMGMITLRGEVITTIDLKKVLGFSDTKVDERSRLLIIKSEDKSLALLVDFVDEVKDISLANIEDLPQQFKDGKIEGIYKDKKEITSIISQIYLKEIISKYFVEAKDDKTTNDVENKEETNMSEMAVFSISNEEFSIDIEDVQEIIKYEEITSVPEAPEFIDGIINLRGVIIPIVSLPERLGFEKNISEGTKILVCNIKDNKIGFLVDDVNEILFVEDKYVNKSDSQDALFDEIINLDDGKRVILKLKASSILSDETLEDIKMMEK
jgi:purine-binding chemotaxis protein CheW